MPPERVGWDVDGGSAVSTAPLGPVPGEPPSVVAGQARRAASIVVGDDPLVGDAAALIAVAVAIAAQRSGLVEPEAFVAGVAAQVRDGRVRRALRQLPTLAAAAATGALAGAYLGQQHVSPQWTDRLAGQLRLAATAAALASLRHPARPGGGHRRPVRSSAGPPVGIGDRLPAGTAGGGKGYR
jgi:hypothetical protein